MHRVLLEPWRYAEWFVTNSHVHQEGSTLRAARQSIYQFLETCIPTIFKETTAVIAIAIAPIIPSAIYLYLI